jgi:hypothetical protein
MTMQVSINDLANQPHHEGQVVLQAERSDFEVKIKYDQGTYWVFGFVRQPGGGEYTRLAAPRSLVSDTTELARKLWREGKDFDTVCG